MSNRRPQQVTGIVPRSAIAVAMEHTRWDEDTPEAERFRYAMKFTNLVAASFYATADADAWDWLSELLLDSASSLDGNAARRLRRAVLGINQAIENGVARQAQGFDPAEVLWDPALAEPHPYDHAAHAASAS